MVFNKAKTTTNLHYKQKHCSLNYMLLNTLCFFFFENN
jgi:hypothetical protein